MLAETSYTIQLPKLDNAKVNVPKTSIDPWTIAQQWISKLEVVVGDSNVSQLDSLIHQDCWWRDMLVFTWDYRSIHGLDKLKDYLGGHISGTQYGRLRLRDTGKFAPRIQEPAHGLRWIESMFDFETKTGRGTGMLRLAQGSDGLWKGCMIYTALTEIKEYEEHAGMRRPHGGNNSLLGGAIQGNWQERRLRQSEFLDRGPTVLIIGSGTFYCLGFLC